MTKKFLPNGILILGVLAFASFPFRPTEWKLSLQTWSFNRGSLLEAIDRADSCGIHYIEAFPGQRLGGKLIGNMGPAMGASERQQLLAYLKGKGIVLIAYGVVDGTDETKTESDWRSCFAFAKDMGIKLITAMPTKGQLDLVNALSGQYQIPVAIHGEPGENAYSRPDSVLKAIQNRPKLGACVDIGNWTRNGVDVLDCIKHQLRGRIFSLHLKDVQEAGARRAAEVPLGHGVIPIPAILDELEAQGFSGIFSIEHPSHQGAGHVGDIREDVRYFRAQLQRLGQKGS